jgi:hypothetical protein
MCQQVATYADLTAPVNQSREQRYHGHLARQGFPWLLFEAAIKLVQQDVALANFYQLEATAAVGTTTSPPGSVSLEIISFTAARTQTTKAPR